MVASAPFAAPVKPARYAPACSARQKALDDLALVRRCNDGDESAFVEIMKRHAEKLFSIAFSVLRNRADAEEIVQDTFASARRNLAQFRGEASLSTWLHQIVLNFSRNRYWYYLRRGRNTTRSFDTGFGDNETATLAGLVASSDPSPVDEAATNEFLDLITLCMERLGPGNREILTRRNLRNESYDEIAKTLGISTGTVKSRIARARSSLRGLLAKACPEFADSLSPSEWFFPGAASGRLAVMRA
jgi:RNA polymerase sigma-70 factor (ECF subfamily)